jgi:hypothetical protein
MTPTAAPPSSCVILFPSAGRLIRPAMRGYDISNGAGIPSGACVGIPRSTPLAIRYPLDGTLEGGDILPNFTLSLREVFDRAERRV